MHEGVGVGQIVVLLAAAIALVTLFRFLRLGAMAGYFAAGVIIGPFGLGLFQEIGSIMTIAEFGMVMFLFLVGLELRPSSVWAMRGDVFGLGTVQWLAVAAAMSGLLIALGVAPLEAAAGGAALAFTSTAVLLALTQSGQANTEFGERTRALVLMESIISLIAIATLSFIAAAIGGSAQTFTLRTAATPALALILVLIAGRWLLPPMLRLLARTGVRELMTAAALLIVLGGAIVSDMIGLSSAIGGFLAGVLLSGSSFRRQLEADIEPFRGILMGLFLMSVGMMLNVTAALASWPVVAVLLLAILLGKGLVTYMVARLFRADHAESLQRAAYLSQSGELGAVLVTVAIGVGLMQAPLSAALISAGILSVTLSPLLVGLIQPIASRAAKSASPTHASARATAKPMVVIAGMGRFGQIVNRMLTAQDIRTIVIDHNIDILDIAAAYDQHGQYGDASNPAILRAAGIADAKLFVVAIDQRKAALDAVCFVKQAYPHIRVVARALDRAHFYELRDAKADTIVLDQLDDPLIAAEQALLALDVHPSLAERARSSFKDHEEEALGRLYSVWEHNVSERKNAKFLKQAKVQAAMLGEILALDREAQQRTRTKARVFISYSRSDSAFVETLRSAMTDRGYSVLVDRHEIAAAEAWRDRLDSLIRASDAVVFVVTDAALASTECAWEVQRTLDLNKRLVPIAHGPLRQEAPAALQRLNWTFSDDPGAGASAPDTPSTTAIDKICAACDVEIEWVREHSRLVDLAARWDKSGRQDFGLLAREELDEANAWLARRPPQAPALTEPLLALLHRSEQALASIKPKRGMWGWLRR